MLFPQRQHDGLGVDELDHAGTPPHVQVEANWGVARYGLALENPCRLHERRQRRPFK